MIAYALVADWKEYWTEKQINAQLSPFTYRGCGWYFDNSGGTTLILETFTVEGESQKYMIMYWARLNPIPYLKKLADMPVVATDQVSARR